MEEQRLGRPTGYPLSNEFLLAAACAIWPPSPRRNNTIASAAKAVDWQRFLPVAHRHRVIGLVRHGLKHAGVAVPHQTWQSISAATTNQLHQNLLFAAETVRLSRTFHEHGLQVSVIKGIPAALDIYGDLALRHMKDIDLLVARRSIFDADRIMIEAGYERVRPPPGMDRARIAILTSIAKDFVYLGPGDSPLEIELHWRLFENQAFMNALNDAAVPKRYPELDDAELLTFTGADQFAYLCAHGAAFAWARLKWLADVAAIVAAAPPNVVIRLYEAAAARGGARPAAQALLLCHRLLGSVIPEGIIRRFRSDRAVRMLEALALTALTQNGSESEPYDLPAALAPARRSLWLLGGSTRFLLGKINTHLIGWDDVVSVPLPRRLQFLYLLLRGPMWLWRRAQRVVARPKTVAHRVRM